MRTWQPDLPGVNGSWAHQAPISDMAHGRANGKAIVMRSSRISTTYSAETTEGLRLAGIDSGSSSDFSEHELSENSLRALAAVEDASRRIDDLARRLGCLGFFDKGDGPRAA